MEQDVTRAETSAYIHGLDGFRALAVMVVFISHYLAFLIPDATFFLRLFPGMLGVTLFFVISGFLITTLLLREKEKHNTIGIKNFYIRRFLRLTPALLIYVGVFFGLYSLVDKSVDGWDFISAITYTSNYYQIQAQTALYYMPVWSLAIEEHFYLLFPLLLLATLKRSIRTLAGSIIIVIIACSLWRYYVALDNDVDWHHIYWRTDTRIDSILFGCLLACVMRYEYFPKIANLIKTNTSLIVAICMMIFTVIYRDDYFRMTTRYTFQGISLMMIVGYVIFSREKIAEFVRIVFEWNVLRYISKISYSLYLWHLTILMFCRHVVKSEGMGSMTPLMIVGCAVLSVIIAAFSYEYVEKPFIKWRQKFGPDTKEPAGLIPENVGTSAVALNNQANS